MIDTHKHLVHKDFSWKQPPPYPGLLPTLLPLSFPSFLHRTQNTHLFPPLLPRSFPNSLTQIHRAHLKDAFPLGFHTAFSPTTNVLQ